jgi:HEAT repeat protein
MDRGAIGAYLRQFKPDPFRDKKIAVLIAKLGARDFKTREAAMQSIRNLAITPRRLLTRAIEHEDLEIGMRAKRLLGEAGDKDLQRLQRVLQQIVRHKVTGLTAELLPVLEYASGRPAVAVRAMVVTSSKSDETLLREQLSAASSVVREAAVTALGQHLGSNASAELKKLLTDSDNRVTLAAARALANVGDRSSLPILVKLLKSTRFGMRYEAVRILRFVSSKKFNYRADAEMDSDTTASAIDAWRTWLQSEGKTATLRFPIKLDEVMHLFNGLDLVGWQPVLFGALVKETDVWQVTKGVLVCNGNGRGYLRTKRKFTNYQLTVEYRWPTQGGDSGVWLMMPGPDSRMPTALEIQLLAGKAGDFWKLGNFDCKVRGKPLSGYGARIGPANEKALGQWNVCQTTLLNGKLTVKINGVEQNNAHDCPKAPGHIALQVEGDALEFRRIELKPLGP